MRLSVYQHDLIPGVDKPGYRLSYARCVEAVTAGTHFWLPCQRDGIQAYPPVSTEAPDDSLLLGIEKDGALDLADSVHNATGSADEKRAALRPSGKLDSAESAAMQKVRNYQTADIPAIPPQGEFPGQPKQIVRGVKAWSDCVRVVSAAEFAAMTEVRLPSLQKTLARGV